METGTVAERVRRHGLLWVLTLAVSTVLARPAAAQNQCQLARSDVTTITQQGTLGETIYIGAPVIVCDDGSQIEADSAVISPPLSLSRLMGRVRFAEVGRTLTADSARYQTQIDRLFAWGRVALTDSTGGSNITGDTLIYLRGGDTRPQDHLTVLGRRVEAVLVPAPTVDSTGAPTGADAEPYHVIARRSIVIEGEQSFEALGEVQLEQQDLRAFADTARYDEAEGTLVLGGRARAIGEGYELSGRRLTALMEGQDVHEVLAERSARLNTDEVDLTAPLIRIFVDTQVLQRLVAGRVPSDTVDSADEAAAAEPERPRIAQRFQRDPEEGETQVDLSRATAVSEEFLMRADSLDVLMPGEELDRAVAIGDAHGESYARDSLTSSETEQFLKHDWLEGDTVIAVFVPKTMPAGVGAQPGDEPVAGDSVMAGDSAARIDSAAVVDSAAVPAATAPLSRGDYVMQSLTALGNARSMYRMQPTDSTLLAPTDRRVAVHYVLADAIVINMQDGEVTDMETVGQTRGIHLEPGPVPGALTPDSVPVPPVDTTGTLSARAVTPVGHSQLGRRAGAERR